MMRPTNVQAQASTAGWISVSDRLPPIGQEVLVHVPGSARAPVTALMRLIPWEGSPDFYWDNAYPGKGNMHIGPSVAHWMPLPAWPDAVPTLRGAADVQPVGRVWYDREDGFYFAKITAQERVKAGDDLYLAAVPRWPLPQPGAADRFARARQALQQGIDKCAVVTATAAATTESSKE